MGDRISFFKMSACGNDFCLIDNREGRFPTPAEPVVKDICRRRISLGADGLILVEKSGKAFFRMRFFNSDGGEAEMCGNGARCVARFAYIKKIAFKKMSFETQAGLVNAVVTQNGARIGIGTVRLSQEDAKVSLQDVIPDNDAYHITVGVPHVVCFVNDLERLDVDGLGKKIRRHSLFLPNGTNANFVKITGARSIMIRTYERGVEGETLACGTGSTAAVIVATGLGLVTPPVEVMTRSGCPLKVDFERDGGLFKEIWLEGEARVVCAGELWLDELNISV
ncbi:diaminopimelate epimerase [bacterium]|nr:diaminopimelate epimerase [bacterium]